jgi:hypothetical protein
VEVIFTSLDSKKNKDVRNEKKKVISRATTESGDSAVTTALEIKKRAVDAVVNATFAERRNFAEDMVKLTKAEVKQKVVEIQTRHTNTLLGNREFMKEVDNFYCVLRLAN